MPELSVIVPVYNVERYLDKCIKSILGQLYKNFELILIDDGSTDESGMICDFYAKLDNRITVIHQNNAGVSAARNAGIKLMRGSFVSFIDADDYIAPEMFGCLIGLLKEKRADIASCAMAHVNQTGKVVQIDFQKEGVFSNSELMTAIFSSPNPIGGGAMNKVFRWHDQKQHYFREDKKYTEDWEFLYEMCKEAKLGVHVEDILYYQVIRPDSATNKDKVQAMYNIIKGTDEIRESTKAYSIDVYRMATNKFLDNSVRYMNQIKSIAASEQVDIRHIKKNVRKRMLSVLCEAIRYRYLPLKKCLEFLYLCLKL